MKRLLRDLYSLLFPESCAVCGRTLPEGGDFMCSDCRWELPLTGFWKHRDNPVSEKFKGHLPLHGACSYFYYVHQSGFRDMVHSFKYKGSWRLAQKMGIWFGEELKASGLFVDVDVIIPVPLHLRKLLKRGYNQSEYIAEGISRSLGVPVRAKAVRRVRHNASQTSRRKSERWDNVKGIFAADPAQWLENSHILLVDDVLTTGATLISCGEELARVFPGCRISIATLAVSRSELESKGARVSAGSL